MSNVAFLLLQPLSQTAVSLHPAAGGSCLLHAAVLAVLCPQRGVRHPAVWVLAVLQVSAQKEHTFGITKSSFSPSCAQPIKSSAN